MQKNKPVELLPNQKLVRACLMAGDRIVAMYCGRTTEFCVDTISREDDKIVLSSVCHNEYNEYDKNESFEETLFLSHLRIVRWTPENRDYECKNQAPLPRRAIAIDFDGTLFEEKNWPLCGKPYWRVIFHALKEQRNGSELILYTSRSGQALKTAIEACEKVGLHFDAINDSCEDWKEYYHNNPRKVGATEYWDNLSVNPLVKSNRKDW